MVQAIESAFEVPAYVPTIPKEKRLIREADSSMLKPQQKEAYTRMVNFLGTSGYFLLKGYAGTGKTFTLGKVMEQFINTYRGLPIAITAPTNKAVRVIYESADFTHPNIHYLTVHKLLGLMPKNGGNGKLEFVVNKRIPAAIEEMALLVIDEVSMLNDELFLLIDTHVQAGRLKVIMMGDPAQIPPVGAAECIPLTEQGQITYGIGVYELTEIQRQENDNPIVDLALGLRNTISRALSFPIQETALNARGEGVVFLNGRDGDKFYEILERYFTSDNFKYNPDFCKVIAWRNVTVDYINKVIRSMIYGQGELRRVEIGEKLVANLPIQDGETIVFNTNDEMEVVGLEDKVEDINKGMYQIHYYLTKVKYKNLDGVESEQYIKLVGERSLPVYRKILETLRKDALGHPKGSFAAIQAWQTYFTFQGMFADVNYNYAVTCHKAQGSTYDRVFVMEKDINASFNIVERNRIKYTACTRPKHQLFILC